MNNTIKDIKERRSIRKYKNQITKVLVDVKNYKVKIID